MTKKELLKILSKAKPDDEIVFQITCINKEDNSYLIFIGSVYRDKKILIDFSSNRHN